ncbi:hypothetical protein AMS68_005228 [Peltaster fructicola]|uniref:G-protein coupled receptors family 1 profile domain-containing protein n=1 Tax=Peltaster fructicola TaxID=286661 RepID=A0A6H0XYH4_9PEZI|nr:hypothetical protein AMS68_005228 [Peltaster fructicola]
MPSIPTETSNSDLIFSLIEQAIGVLSSDGSENGYHVLAARRPKSAMVRISLADQQRRTIQIVSTVMASVSITASFLALYWFCLMRRNFRRDLVLLLILGDILKNFCFIMYGSVNLTRGQIHGADAFCQASGYILQTSLEACDLAVFFVSLHMTLQIFPLPSTKLGYDGLYNVRRWVYAIWAILPNLTASVAFIATPAYQVQGALCWLPVRPFWYRLALSWIPRYIITFLILCFAIAIYIHVGVEFRVFGAARDRKESTDLSVEEAREAIGSGTIEASVPFVEDHEPELKERAAAPAPTQDDRIRNLRRASSPVWNSPFDVQVMDDVVRGTRSEAGSRRGSRQVAFNFSDESISPEQTSDLFRPTLPSLHSGVGNSFVQSSAAENAAGAPVLQETKTVDSYASTTIDAALRTRRRAMRRQVRSLFIYPVAYLIMWILPFVSHCMNYSDYFAENPVFAISLLSSFCLTALGLVDVVIFSWREQPWRHIRGSDGSFLGSLCFWRFGQGMSSMRSGTSGSSPKDKSSYHGTHGFLGALGHFTWRRLSSSAGKYPSSNRSSIHKPRAQGGADSKVRERERAQERLQVEQRLAAERQAATMNSPSPGTRNWFDNIQEDDETTMKSRRPTWSGH